MTLSGIRKSFRAVVDGFRGMDRKAWGIAAHHAFGGRSGILGWVLMAASLALPSFYMKDGPSRKNYEECFNTKKQCTADQYKSALEYHRKVGLLVNGMSTGALTLIFIGQAGVARRASQKRNEELLDRWMETLADNSVLKGENSMLKHENEIMKSELDGRAEAARKRQALEAVTAKEQASQKAAKEATVLKEDLVIEPPLRLKKTGNDGPLV